MTMKWVEAHRNLDAGIPIKDSEWTAIDRSLYWFYGVPAALVMIFAMAISAWGIAHSAEREAAARQRCDAAGKIIVEHPIGLQCIDRERKAK